MSAPLRIGLVGNGDAASDRLTRLLAEQGIHIVYALQPDAIDEEHIAARDIDVWLFDIDDASWSDAIDALMDGSPVPVFFNEHAAINRQPHVEYWCRNLITRMQELVSEPDLMPPSRAVETRGETLHIAFPRSVETALAKEPPNQLDPALLEEIEELEALLHIDEAHAAPGDDWLFNSASGSDAATADAGPAATVSGVALPATEGGFIASADTDADANFASPPAVATDDNAAFGENILSVNAAETAAADLPLPQQQAAFETGFDADIAAQTVAVAASLSQAETMRDDSLPLVDVADIDMAASAPSSLTLEMDAAWQAGPGAPDADMPPASLDTEFAADLTLHADRELDDMATAISAAVDEATLTGASGLAGSFEIEQYGEFETLPLAAVSVEPDAQLAGAPIASAQTEAAQTDAAQTDAAQTDAMAPDMLTAGAAEVQPDYSAELAPPLLESVAASGAFEQLASGETGEQAADNAQDAVPALPCDLWILGASLGGPAALKRFFAALTEPVPVCFLLAQHIDAHFLPVLGKILEQSNSFYRVAVLSRPGLIEAGALLLAPTEKRLRFIEAGQIVLSQKTWTPPYSPCIDDVMLDAVEAYGRQVNAIVFSGMGEDGVHGARAIRVAGGEVWTQDAESCASAVMPDAVFDAGYACRRAAPEILAEQLMARYHDAGTQRSQRS